MVPKTCAFHLGCYKSGMDRHHPGIVLLIAFSILWGCLQFYGIFLNKSVRKFKELVDSTIEEEHTTSKETKIGTLAKKRQEQDAYLNNLMFLTNSQLDVKSLRASIKKHNISIDIDKQTGASNDNIDGKSSSTSFEIGQHLMSKTFIKTSSNSKRLKDIIKSNQFKQYAKMIKNSRDIAASNSRGDRKFVFQEVAEPLCISFDQLNLNLKKDGAPILKEIFGIVKPFNVTALMGASGAGKTTFLSLLRGQASFATTSGNIYVNGNKVESLVPFRNQMAFVPQDDIMYDNLTVEGYQ